METNPRLEVRFKLSARNLPESVALQTDYFRTLSLLGRAWEKVDNTAYDRVMVWIERKGTLVFVDTIKQRLAVAGRAASKTVLVGGQTVCESCKLCTACGQRNSKGACKHTKIRCKCPFPRRIVPWGKAEYEADLEACDLLQRRLAVLHADGKLTLEQHHTKYQWIEGMKRNCKTKLFVARMIMDEQNGTGKPSDPKRGITGRDVSVAPGLYLG